MRKENVKAGLVVSAFVLAVVGAIWYNAGRPTQGHTMEVPDTSDVEDGAPIADVRIPATFTDPAIIGKTVFNAKCAACHGENAAGTGGVAPPLVHQFYRPGHHGDEAFLRAAKNGVTAHHWNFGNMPPVEGITPAEVKYVVSYIRELQRANGVK